MKSRMESARYAESLMNEPSKPKGVCSHFGYQELRLLFDFIWGGSPANPGEMILSKTNGIDRLQEEIERRKKEIRDCQSRRSYTPPKVDPKSGLPLD